MHARLGLVLLAVTDLPRACAFYRAAFGFDVTVEVPVYVELALPDGMRLGLYAREGFARNTGQLPVEVPQGAIAGSELYFLVDDVEAAAARLEAAGGRLLSARAARYWGDEAAYYADPNGNVVVVARTL